MEIETREFIKAVLKAEVDANNAMRIFLEHQLSLPEHLRISEEEDIGLKFIQVKQQYEETNKVYDDFLKHCEYEDSHKVQKTQGPGNSY
jgi:hypothetical protein